MESIDPICGMKVVREDAAASVKKDGLEYFFCSTGCKEKFVKASATFAAPIQIGRNAAPEIKTARDPVCDMLVDINNPAATFEHHGETQYFCAESCKLKFRQNPRLFLEGICKVDHSSSESTEYTCPMDPEVVQIGPGSCPVCGMALEPATVTLSDEPDPELIDMRKRFWIALGLTIPILILAMGGMLIPLKSFISPWASHLIQGVLTVPVVFWLGFPFLERAWVSFKNLSPNMFTLIAIGTLAATFYSFVALLIPGVFPDALIDENGLVDVYFESAAVITTLVLLGQMLEVKARGQTNEALRSILKLSPPNATVRFVDGVEEEIPVEKVIEGATVTIRAHEFIPLDGVVTKGASAIDKSLVTGESIPIDVGVGDEVIGGTQNGAGYLEVETTAVGGNTVLSQIVRLVGEAQRSKAPVQRIADNVSKFFVPVVILVALLAFGVWLAVGSLGYAVVAAVSVLIIACPCALGLATPMSVMVGSGEAAKQGILFRNAEAIETLGKVDAIAFDKTGTLTLGEPEIESVVACSEMDEMSLVQIAASLEKGSEHPLAKAFLKYSEKKEVELSEVAEFSSHSGEGVSGKCEGERYFLGNEKFLMVQGIEFGVNRLVQKNVEGKTVVYLGNSETTLGAFVIGDVLRSDANDLIKTLKDAGIRSVMITGDNESTAATIAEKVGIEEVFAETLPSSKADIVKDLQEKFGLVAMIGDGVNDAPALSTADVGIAMASGTEVAVEAADVTLLNSELKSVWKSIELSQLTMKNIRQNLGFAFAYNLVGVPIAAGILYPFLGMLLSPMIASVAMTFSSLSVIGNSLRLRAK